MKTKTVEMHGQQVQVTICPPATVTQMQANGRAGLSQTMAIKVSTNSAERTTGTVRVQLTEDGQANHMPATRLRAARKSITHPKGINIATTMVGKTRRQQTIAPSARGPGRRWIVDR